MRISDWSSDVCSSDLLNRHQDDDDVLAVDEDAQHAKHEQDRADGQIMAQSDRHSVTPCPVSGFSSRTASSGRRARSEEHTSELQSLMRISYAVFCLKKQKIKKQQTIIHRDPPIQ